MSTDWKTYELGTLLPYEQPTAYIVESTDYNDDYPTPVLTAGKSFIIGYTNETSGIYKSLPVIIFDDFTTSCQYVNFPFKVKSSAMKILSPNTELVLPKFIYYRMKVIQFDHSTHKRYWIQQYSKIKVKVPSIPEQERIVSKIEELFSKLDASVAELQTAKEKLKVYRQAVLKEAFEGRLTAKWRTCHFTKSACALLEEIQDQYKVIGYTPMLEYYPLFPLPELWQWVSIGNISTGAEYGSSKKSQKIGQIPVLRMGNIKNGIIDWTDLVYTNDKDEIDKYELHVGDVLFNRTNSPDLVGKTATYTGPRKAIYAGYLIRVNQVPTIDSNYLTYFLNSSIAREYGNKVKTDGVNQSNINGKKLYSYPFPLCSLEEQKQVVYELEARLSVCDQIIMTINCSLQQVEALRQSILKQAFEGWL